MKRMYEWMDARTKWGKIFFFLFCQHSKGGRVDLKKNPIEWMHWIESVYITVFVNQSKPEKRRIFFSYNIHRKKLDDDDYCLGLASLILFRKQYGSTIYTLYCHRCYDVFLFIHHLGFILFVWKQRTKRKRVGYILWIPIQKKTNSLQWFNVFEFLNPKEVQRSICWTNKQNKIKNIKQIEPCIYSFTKRFSLSFSLLSIYFCTLLW